MSTLGRPGAGSRRKLKIFTRAFILAGALLGLGFGGFAALERLDVAMATMQVAQPSQPSQPPGPPDGGVPTPPPLPAKVKIYFFTVPVAKTELRWGKRKLGIINPTVSPKNKRPFFIERPRDSGPMDVVARAEGFLPLNTRVHTYTDGKVWLKLTPEAEKHLVLGYKQAIPDGGADGGVPDAGVLMPTAGPPAPLQPGPPIGPAMPPPAPGAAPVAAPPPQPQ